MSHEVSRFNNEQNFIALNQKRDNWETGKRSEACYEREITDLKQQRDDLLEVCENLIETLLGAGYDSENSSVVEIAEAAIAKAKT